MNNYDLFAVGWVLLRPLFMHLIVSAILIENALAFMFVLQSWESLPLETATFTSDITPLILAAHRDNYEIIKILLDRGATLPMPHDVR